eukprot:snap_masked-scaffold_2-processed-gene-26.32-mRNA-1 protein AED:1.00 eAED:1.00 QI:0/0/0/0/1/1/2/0/105
MFERAITWALDKFCDNFLLLQDIMKKFYTVWLMFLLFFLTISNKTIIYVEYERQMGIEEAVLTAESRNLKISLAEFVKVFIFASFVNSFSSTVQDITRIRVKEDL